MSFFSMKAQRVESLHFRRDLGRVAETSNRVIRVDAALPREQPRPGLRVPIPSADTSPMPVTTTRLFTIAGPYFLLFAFFSM